MPEMSIYITDAAAEITVLEHWPNMPAMDMSKATDKVAVGRIGEYSPGNQGAALVAAEGLVLMTQIVDQSNLWPQGGANNTTPPTEVMGWVKVYWLARGGDGSSDYEAEVTVRDGHILVGGAERDRMVEAIRNDSGPDDDMAADMAALKPYAGWTGSGEVFDVTDFGGGILQQGLADLGIAADEYNG